MSDTDERKSMDDVLASIRRIVKSEKEPEAAIAMPPVAERPVPEAFGGEIDEPLELTSDMRMDSAEEESQEDEAQEASPEMASDTPTAPALDMDEIKGMVREVVMEQLSSDQGSALVRNILREELMSGEIGANMSQNVMALIQAEVGKALKG